MASALCLMLSVLGADPDGISPAADPIFVDQQLLADAGRDAEHGGSGVGGDSMTRRPHSHTPTHPSAPRWAKSRTHETDLLFRGQSPTLTDPFSTGTPLSPSLAPQTTQPLVIAPPQYNGGLYAGYENVIVQPFFENDNAFAIGLFPTNTVINFDWDLDYSPRVWVGFDTPGGVGFQARYWNFDHDTGRTFSDTGTTIFAPFIFTTAAGDHIMAKHSLELHVQDYEVTWRNVEMLNWAVTVSGGMRILDLENVYDATVFPGLASTRIDQDFFGAGPTVGLTGRRRLGGSNFALFASGRLSGVYGERQYRHYTTGPLANVRSSDQDDLIGIAESQLGVEYATPVVSWTGMRLFVRAALEAQLWLGSGTGANVQSLDLPTSENMGFFGLSVATGVTF